MRFLGALLVLPTLAMGCASKSVPPTSAPTPEPAPVSAVTFDLRDTSVADMLLAIAAASGKPVMIAPEAQTIARCARVTLIATEVSRVDGMAPLVGKALRSVSLELEVSDDGWLVRRGEGPAPSTCDGAPQVELPAESDAADPERIDSALSGIRQVTENEFEVRRSSLDAILENQASLMRSARIVPEVRDGKVNGVRLFGLRTGSVLHVLGFRNGDKILRVGGLPIHGPDKALEAYEKVRKADVIEVDIERKGKPISIVYRVIPD